MSGYNLPPHVSPADPQAPWNQSGEWYPEIEEYQRKIMEAYIALDGLLGVLEFLEDCFPDPDLADPEKRCRKFFPQAQEYYQQLLLQLESLERYFDSWLLDQGEGR